MTPDPTDRTLPTLITLVIVAVLLMTFDIRLQGGGVVAVLRGGAQTVVAPLQRGASAVVNPVADFLDGLTAIASLRAENQALRAELGTAQAQLDEVEDDLARLATMEELNDLGLDESEIGQTPANVIGSPDPSFDPSFLIDKGTSDGVLVGQPVIDVYGYAVGTVTDVSPTTATVVPIVAGRNAVVVLVGDQVGQATAQPGLDDMLLEVLDARYPVSAGDQVMTSSASTNFPGGLPVGEVAADSEPESTALTALVTPYVDVEALRVVVVLAWPPDPLSVPTSTLPAPAEPEDPEDAEAEG